jgi:hypothetical protein
MNTIFAQIQELTGATDYASAQSDRWLFVAMLIVFLCAMYFTVRWGMAQLANRDGRIDALNDKLNSYLMTSVEKLSGVIAHNTDVIRANTEMSARKMNILERVEQVINKP